jgi:hypothetical protein
MKSTNTPTSNEWANVAFLVNVDLRADNVEVLRKAEGSAARTGDRFGQAA